MHVYLNSGASGRAISCPRRPTLLVDLRDSSGINTSTAGIGHRIEAWINSSTQSKDLTEHYTSTLDDFREGTVQYRAERTRRRARTPSASGHGIRYNNSAAGGDVLSRWRASDSLTIIDVFNYPNPFAGATRSRSVRIRAIRWMWK